MKKLSAMLCLLCLLCGYSALAWPNAPESDFSNAVFNVAGPGCTNVTAACTNYFYENPKTHLGIRTNARKANHRQIVWLAPQPAQFWVAGAYNPDAVEYYWWPDFGVYPFPGFNYTADEFRFNAKGKLSTRGEWYAGYPYVGELEVWVHP